MAQDKKYWEEYIKKTVPEYMQKGEPSKPEPDRVAEFDRHYGINVPKNTILDGTKVELIEGLFIIDENGKTI